MDPVAPVSKIQEWSASSNAAAGAILGIGFGFFLEKAGFGNAKTLAGQWYGYNFAVLRVMFTAILVSMLGLFGLHYLGVVDIGQMYINDTFMLPQAIGGLIFGFGFVIGQYCPGTALVACATGKFDAMTFIGGFFLGVLGFSAGYSKIERFYESTPKGRIMLPEYFHLPAGLVVFAVVIIALGAFAFTHFLDKKLHNVPAEKQGS